VPETPRVDELYEVQCPHCRKRFRAEPMSGSAARYAGFKCPHCKLFVPWERAEEQALVDQAD
jgi:endogenous inhibitor of DNA gyrase (YacG/DUF329 family)